MKIQDVITRFGSQAEIARAVGLNRATIAEWFTSGKIPLCRQYQLELLTSGELKADLPADHRGKDHHAGVTA